jgi:hypothetical protein
MAMSRLHMCIHGKREDGIVHGNVHGKEHGQISTLIVWRTGKTCFEERLQLMPSSPIPTQEHAARGESLLTASTPRCHSFDSSLAHLRHLGTLEPRATITTLG